MLSFCTLPHPCVLILVVHLTESLMGSKSKTENTSWDAEILHDPDQIWFDVGVVSKIKESLLPLTRLTRAHTFFFIDTKKF